MSGPDLRRQERLPKPKQNKYKNRPIIEYGYGGQLHAMLGVVTLILLAFGVVMMLSSSASVSYAAKGDAFAMVKAQLLYTAVGIFLGVVAWLVSPKIYRIPLLSLCLYVITSMMLVAVFVFGVVINGARRWIPLGPINLQVSEVAKVAIVIILACYYTSLKKRRTEGHYCVRTLRRQRHLDGFLDVTLPLLIGGVWVLLVLAQPHVSGAIILSVIVFTMVFTSDLTKTSLKYGMLQLMMGLAALVSVGGIAHVLGIGRPLLEKISNNFAHVQVRMAAFFVKSNVVSESSYQLTQARIAMGSGGIYGVDLGRGAAKFNYLPEAHNDFIFAVIGEELGLIGTLFVLILFVTYAVLCARVVRACVSKNSSSIALGLTVLITTQALFNMGVATGVLPTTGISLPFFSIGGASNIILLVASGVILAVARTSNHEHKLVRSMISEEKKQKRFEQEQRKVSVLLKSKYKKTKVDPANRNRSEAKSDE